MYVDKKEFSFNKPVKVSGPSWVSLGTSHDTVYYNATNVQPLYIAAQLREMIELSFLFSTKVHAWLTYQCFNGNKYLTTQYPNVKTCDRNSLESAF